MPNWKSKKDGTHYQDNKVKRDNGNPDVHVEVDVDDLESFADEKKSEYDHFDKVQEDERLEMIDAVIVSDENAEMLEQQSIKLDNRDKIYNEVQEEYYSDRLDKVVENLKSETESYSARLAETSGIDMVGLSHIAPLIKDMAWQIELELENTNWEYELKENGEKGLHKELSKVKQRIYDHEMYWLDKEFGYSEPSEHDRPKNEGERIAAKLFEGFDRMKDEELGNYKNREADYARGKQIIKDTLDHVFNIAQKEIPRE